MWYKCGEMMWDLGWLWDGLGSFLKLMWMKKMCDGNCVAVSDDERCVMDGDDG